MGTISGLIKWLNIFEANDASKLAQCDVLFFCHDADRPIALEGKAYAPIADSLREEFQLNGLKCQTIAHFGSVVTGEKGYGSPLSLEKRRISFAFINRLARLIPFINFDLNIYDFILAKSKAKLVLTIGAPVRLCEAANKRGVVLAEVLHGIGYKTLPGEWTSRSKEQLPRAILAADSVSVNSFKPLENLGVSIFEIPHPFLKRFTQSKRHVLPVEWRLTIDNLSNYKKVILISLVWGYAGDDPGSPEYNNILKNGLFYDEIAELVHSRKDIFWCFRLHPVQLHGDKYKGIRSFLNDFVEKYDNAEWKLSSTLPFPTVASSCDGSITMSSMSCYDAASVGVCSLILCPNVQKGGPYETMYEDLVSEGYVYKMPVNKEHVETWVSNISKRETRVSNLDDIEGWNHVFAWLKKTAGIQA